MLSNNHAPQTHTEENTNYFNISVLFTEQLLLLCLVLNTSYSRLHWILTIMSGRRVVPLTLFGEDEPETQRYQLTSPTSHNNTGIQLRSYWFYLP